MEIFWFFFSNLIFSTVNLYNLSAFKDLGVINLIHYYGWSHSQIFRMDLAFLSILFCCYFQREPRYVCIHLSHNPPCNQSIIGVEGNGDGHSRHGAVVLWLSSFLCLILPSFFCEEEISQSVNVFLLHFMTLIYGNNSRNGLG